MYFFPVFLAIAMLLAVIGGAFQWCAKREIEQSVNGSGQHDAVAYRVIGWLLCAVAGIIAAGTLLMEYFP